MQKNAKKMFSKIFRFFQTMTLLKNIRLRNLKLFRYLQKKYSFLTKKNGAKIKILIINKDIKVLLTKGTKPKSKIIEKFLTM